MSSIASFLQGAVSNWGSTQSWSSSVAATSSLNSAMSSAMANKTKGLAAIANGEALSRTNSEITSLIQGVLTGSSGTSSTGSTTGTAGTPAKAASGTGNVSLSVSTPLSTLGIPKGGSVYVSVGSNTTTYTSTGSDTVGDLISTINNDLPDNAQVTAKLNSRGDLVLTARNTTNQISVSGVYARNIGFAVGNTTFKPTAAVAAKAPTASPSSSKTTSSTSSTAGLETAATHSATSAASLLSDSGASGSLVNLIA